MLPLLEENATNVRTTTTLTELSARPRWYTQAYLVTDMVRFNFKIAWKRGKLKQILMPIILNIYLIFIMRMTSPDQILPPAKFLNVFSPVRDCVPGGVSVSLFCDPASHHQCDVFFERVSDHLKDAKLSLTRFDDQLDYKSSIRYDGKTVGIRLTSPGEFELDMSDEKLNLMSKLEESEGVTCRTLNDPHCAPVVFFRSCLAVVEEAAIFAFREVKPVSQFNYRINPQRRSLLSGIASTSLAWVIPLYLSGLFLNLYNFALIELVSEKEGRHRDYLTGWGVTRLIHFLSWLVTNCAFGLVAIFVMLGGLFYGDIFQPSFQSPLFLGFLSYFISLLSLAYLVSLRVKSVRTAANLASLTDIVFNITSLSTAAIHNRIISLMLALIPTVPFFMLLRAVALEQARGSYLFPSDLCLLMSLGTSGLILTCSTIACIHEHRTLSQTVARSNHSNFGETVTIRGLTKRYEGSESNALSEVDLSLIPGEIHCLIGANGAGKSTLINTMLRIQSATRCDQFGLPEPHRMALCLQDDAIWESLTVRDHIEFFALQLSRATPERVRDLSQRLSLDSAMDQQCVTLSGGQKRRLSILLAVSKMQSPESELMILDEPTTGVDVEGRRVVWDIVREVSREKAVLLTTHYLDEAQSLSDRVTFLVEGSVRATGRLSDLQSSLNGGYLLRIPKGQIRNVGSLAILRENAEETVFRIPVGEEIHAIEILESLESKGIDFRFESVSLDNMFEQIRGADPDVVIDDQGQYVRSSIKAKWTCSVVETARIRILPKITNPASLFSNIVFPILLIGFSLFARRLGSGWGGVSDLSPERSLTYLDDMRHTCNGTAPFRVPFVGDWSDLLPLPTAFEVFKVPEDVTDMMSFLWGSTEWYPFSIDFVNREVWLNPSSPRLLIGLLSFFASGGAQSTQINIGTYLSDAAYNGLVKSSVIGVIVYVVISLTVISTQCATNIFDEKKSLIKRVAQIQGLDPTAYWSGSALGHLLLNLPVILMAPIAAVLSVGPVLTEVPDAWLVLAASAIVSSAQLVLFGYMVSLGFKSKESMLKFNSLYSVLIYEGVVIGGVWVILTFYRLTFPTVVFWLSLLVPPFHIAGVIAQLAAMHMNSCSLVRGSCDWTETIWSAGLWIPVLAGLIQVSLSLLILSWSERKEQQRFNSPRIEDSGWIFDSEQSDQHSSVSNEKRRIMTGCDDSILFLKLWHHYPPDEKGALKWAVRDLSIGVRKNETLCLLGKNGAGKTSALSILLGLQQQTAGYAGIFGGKKVGFCPQVNALWEGLSGIDHLRFYATIRGCWTGKEYGERLLRTVGLTEIHKKTKSYSGGMKRRLCIAIALVGNPDVLILDEPTAGVDVLGKREIWSVFKSIKHRCSILVTTHSLEEADALSTRVCIMDSGKLVQIGTTAELKRSQQRVVIRFEPCLTDAAHDQLCKFLAVSPDSVMRQSEQDVEVDTLVVPLSRLLRVCDEMKRQKAVEQYSLRQLTLEDVFLRTVET